MEETAISGSPSRVHTYGRAVKFRAKVSLLQLKRALENVSRSRVRRFPVDNSFAGEFVAGESKTRLWTDGELTDERILTAGKVHNLRSAAQRLNGAKIPAGETFSFWAQVGRASRSKGYVAGRELREGCLIPSIGGGLCQLSNALYDAARAADFEIVERHAHTRIVPGSLAERGRDATVFWNYIDLRFRSSAAFRIEAELDAKYLTVKLKTEGERQAFVALGRERGGASARTAPDKINSCASCGVESCFRSLAPAVRPEFGRTAFLLDEFSPEFDDYVRAAKAAGDRLFVPLDGKRFRKANYAWDAQGFAEIKQSPLVTLRRAYRSRRLSAQGAARQRSLLEMSEKLARSYAESISFDVLHLVVQQNLLPFLWRAGTLGGRTYDVLMNALPIEKMHEKLDRAARLHPESRTLADFRAESWLAQTESKALRGARRIITPHTEIAALFPEKTELLPWRMPAAKDFERKKNGKFTVVFPASTVGRKGCYELRDALRGLDVKLIVLGAQIESADFWSGFDVEINAADWLERADLIALPAFVEHKPRRLLQAVANGIPVIASKACGISGVDGVTSLEAGDAGILRTEIEKFFN